MHLKMVLGGFEMLEVRNVRVKSILQLLVAGMASVFYMYVCNDTQLFIHVTTLTFVWLTVPSINQSCQCDHQFAVDTV
jgi:hypothetical protein